MLLHCFVFVTFVHHFNIKRSKSKTLVSGVFIFVIWNVTGLWLTWEGSLVRLYYLNSYLDILFPTADYIHNWSLQPFSQDYHLVSQTTYVVCFNFIHKWWDPQFKLDSERQIFEKLFMAILFTLTVFAKNLFRESRRKNIFIFAFWCLTLGLNSGLISNKPTDYLLDYGEWCKTIVYKPTADYCNV